MALELEVAAAYRLPHSQFLSWSKADRDKAIWHHVRSKTACPHCGTHPEEWDEAQGGNRDAYRTQLRRCRGCQLIASEQTRLQQSGDRYGSGIYISLTPNRPDIESENGSNHPY